MAEPSIVLAKLDDNKLKESIDSLVTHLDNRLKDMKNLTTNAVNDMQKTLQSLGNVKVDTGGSADGGSSKRAKKQKEETQAVKETTVAYDKLAETTSNIAKPKSARESFYAFAQGFKEQAQHLQQLINNWESLALARKIGDFDAVGTAIDQTTQKINALKQEMTQLRRDQPTGYRDQVKDKEIQIEQLKQKLVELRAEQQRIANAPIQDNEYVARYRAQLEQVNSALETHL